jgi:hypothetical protein
VRFESLTTVLLEGSGLLACYSVDVSQYSYKELKSYTFLVLNLQEDTRQI